jgi:hypothetical protein
MKELQNVAQNYDLAKAGPKKELKKRLQLHLNTVYPDWPTDENGLLLFECDFSPQKTTELSTKMTKNELISIIKTFKLSSPSLISNLGFISKDVYAKHIDAQMRMVHPEHPRNQLDVLIFEPEQENLTPTPSEYNVSQ